MRPAFAAGDTILSGTPTRRYVERRTKQGRSKAEIIRCLKRYVAREVFIAIRADLCPRTP